MEADIFDSKKEKKSQNIQSDSLLFSDSKSIKLTEKDLPNESLGAILDKVKFKNLKGKN